MGFALDYSRSIHLDAEDLAENGIDEGYQRVLPELSRLIPEPADMEEAFDPSEGRYSVRCQGQDYLIYVSEAPEYESWARAAHALFQIVNKQLSDSAYRLYAINGGNDLHGIFLTGAECEAARAGLSHQTDWPYLPTLDPPWYGQSHP